MKRVLRLLLLAFVVQAVSVGVVKGQAAKGTVDVDGVKWRYEESAAGSGKCRVELAKKDEVSGAVVVPGALRDGMKDYAVIGLTDGAVSRCAGITKLTIPAGVEEIASVQAFAGASSLQEIVVEKGNKYFSSIDGVLFSHDATRLLYCPESKSGRYEVPASVKAIESGAFGWNRKLTEVVLGRGVELVGGYAFYNAASLEAVTIPGNVSTISWYAFYGCSALKRVAIDEGVRSIGASAFLSCGALVEVRLPASVREIGDGAFAGTGITSVEVPGGVKRLHSTFAMCEKLARVSIHEGVEELDEGVFRNCTLLEEVRIPMSVRTIGESAFTQSAALVSVTVPRGVSAVGATAFLGCSSLREVYWLAGADCQVSTDAVFEGISSPATLYVRVGEKSKMTDPSGWYKGFTIEEGYVVSFVDADGAELLGEQLVKADGKQKVARPADFSKGGQVFKGWRKKGATEAFDFAKELVTSDMTLEAWFEVEPNVQLSYDEAVVKVTRGGALVANGANVQAGDELVIVPVESDRVFAELKVNGVAVAEAEGQMSYIYKVQAGDASVRVEALVRAMKGDAVESVLLSDTRVVGQPVGDALVLEGVEGAERVEVYSLTGARVCTHQLRGEARVAIGLGGCAAGVYVVRVAARDGARTIRIVKR